MSEDERSESDGRLVFTASRLEIVVLVAAWLLCTFCCFWLAIPTGQFLEQSRAERRRYEEEKRLLEPVLAADPAFANLSISQSAYGVAVISGDVPTEADRERLREVVTQALGKAGATKVLRHVEPRR